MRRGRSVSVRELSRRSALHAAFRSRLASDRAARRSGAGPGRVRRRWRPSASATRSLRYRPDREVAGPAWRLSRFRLQSWQAVTAVSAPAACAILTMRVTSVSATACMVPASPAPQQSILPAPLHRLGADGRDDILHRGRLLGIVEGLHVLGAQQQAAVVGGDLQARQRRRDHLAQASRPTTSRSRSTGLTTLSCQLLGANLQLRGQFRLALEVAQGDLQAVVAGGAGGEQRAVELARPA